MTDKTPTIADCIEWLDECTNEFTDKINMAAKPSPYYMKRLKLADAIRTQLIAAQGMAKALDDVLEEIQHPQLKQFMRESGITTPKLDRLVVAAIEKKSAWREAGGE